MPGILLGEEFPNFEAITTIGNIKFHDFLGDSHGTSVQVEGLGARPEWTVSHLDLGEGGSHCPLNLEPQLPVIDFAGNRYRWGVLFSHPRDYTPVCTTELGRAVQMAPEFEKRGVKMIALSIDNVQDHFGWSKDINAYNGEEEPTETLPFPIIEDPKRELAVLLGMLDPDEKDNEGMPVTARCVFIIGPDKKMKLSILYPATTGRNFDEILRVIDSLQLTSRRSVATPVDWQCGDRVMVPPTMSQEDASKNFPCGVFTKEVPSGKLYLRYTAHPK